MQRIYGDTVGFLAAWTWIVAIMPGTLAILSIACVEVAYSAAGITQDASRIEHKLLSVLVLFLMSLANSFSTKASTRLNNLFVVVKFATILAVVVAGLAAVGLHLANPKSDVGGGDWHRRAWFEARDTVNPDGSRTHWADLSQWELFGHFSEALYAALWAYSGWDKVGMNHMNQDLISRILTGTIAGCICQCRALKAREAVATRHQRGPVIDYCVFSGCQRSILRAPSVEGRIDDRQRRRGESKRTVP